MKAYAHPSTIGTEMRHGEGYLFFMAYLQIVAGALNLIFSAFAIGRAATTGNMDFLGLTATTDALGGVAGIDLHGILASMMAGYMVIQLAFGWVAGLMMIGAAICCLKRRGRWFVAASSVLNLFNFPHGTTVAIMMLHGLSRPGISRVFDEDR